MCLSTVRDPIGEVQIGAGYFSGPTDQGSQADRPSRASARGGPERNHELPVQQPRGAVRGDEVETEDRRFTEQDVSA